MTAPAREDFERWQDDLITRWVFKACEAQAKAQEDAWRQASWVNGINVNLLLLTELRTRADAYRALFETDYDGWLETNDQAEPRT